MPKQPKEIDPTARLAEGFTPSAIVVGPDGATMPVAASTASSPVTIPICQLGPCVHYHQLTTKIDSQDPEDGSVGEVFTNTTRTCYPSPGIEMDISLHPPCNCSLWEPRQDLVELRERRRQTYRDSEQGRIELAEFEASWPDKIRY